MAKAKEVKEEVEDFDIDVMKDLTKKYGSGCAVSANFILEEEKQIISLTPVLDIALSGGVPEGIIILSSGKSKCGKSTTSLHFAARCQKLGKKVFYLDVEGRLSIKNLKGIHGLDIDALNVIRSTKEKILSAQDYLMIAEDIITKVPGCLIIIDSTSALCDSSERTEEITASTRNKGPKLLASFCRRIGNIVPVNGTIVWIIQHMIANTSGFGAPFMEDGGNKIVYQADIKIRSKSFSDWKRGDVLIGQSIKWDVEFSALGAPGASVESYLRYGHGIDEEYEIVNLGIDMGLIEKTGKSWFEPIFLTKHKIETKKVNGQDNMTDYFRENKEHLDLLHKEIKGMLSGS